MQIHQVVVTLSYGDGVSNDALAIYNILKRNGFETDIYTFEVDPRVQCNDCKIIDETVNFAENDVIIYHLCTGTVINEWFSRWKGKKIVRYHNITPPEWFEGIDDACYQFCMEGLKEVQKMAACVEYCLPVSEFNLRDLEKMGYQCEMDVLPIIVPFDEYANHIANDIVKQYMNDGYTNVIFSGRIVPNKCQQDVMTAFAYYQKAYNQKSRLFLVGGYSEENEFYKTLLKMRDELEVENVVFTNHVSKEELISYYKLSDVFLCMSEHEGFCIPLIEAMLFDIPIVAYNSTAIPETLGGGGVLVDKKEWSLIAREIHHVVSDIPYQQEILLKQRERLKCFETSSLERRFLQLLDAYIVKKNS